MLSVELAFERFVARNGLGFETTRYCLEDQAELHVPGQAVKFCNLRERYEQALAADLIVFWGDFLHAWNYHVHDVLPEIRRDPQFASTHGALSEREVAALMRRYLLLSDAPDEVLAKTLSFGTTLLGDHALIHAIDPGYETDLKRFVSRCRGIWMRDAISALRVSHFQGSYGQCHLGVDCALLLQPEDLAQIAAGHPGRSESAYAAVHFGRTTIHHGPTLDFARQLCAKLALRPVWLSWLHANPKYFQQFRNALPELDATMPQDPPYAELLAGMLGAKLVITDTYHLSILAWRAGIPVICVGAGAELALRTLSDKKKEIFHLMYGASPYYLFVESLVDPAQRQRKLHMLVDALAAKEVLRGVSACIGAHARAAEGQLLAAIAP